MKTFLALLFLCLLSCSRETGKVQPLQHSQTQQPAQPQQPTLPQPQPQPQQLSVVEPENVGRLPECHAADLFSALKLAPLLKEGVIAFSSPDDSRSPGTRGVCWLSKSMEKQLLAQSTNILNLDVFDDPEVFPIAQVEAPPGYAIYAVRVPGQYSSSAIDLLIYRADGSLVQPAVNISESWSDDGDVFWSRGWLVDVTGKGTKDVIVHTCVTTGDPESSDPPTVGKDTLEIRHWTTLGFSEPEPIDDPDLKNRFASGKQSCGIRSVAGPTTS